MNTALIKPQWSPLTIALMVLGFVFFAPLGFAMLAYILFGERLMGSADRAGAWFNRQKSWANCQGHGFARRGFTNAGFGSGNVAFDEYREEQLRRLDEERRRLDEEINDFHEYMRNLRMAKDREEFDRFMRDRNGTRPNYDPPRPRDDQGPGNGY
ncbi:MAG TPA: DUF2852 domain-containing protein [Devosiaceae bacterium]|jgi:hypothetical protein